jgi:hypothetical protein
MIDELPPGKIGSVAIKYVFCPACVFKLATIGMHSLSERGMDVVSLSFAVVASCSLNKV